MIILGSTGSIGVNTLTIAQKFGLHVEALCAGSNVELLNEQIKLFNPLHVAIGDKSLAHKVNHSSVFVGEDGILQMIEVCKSELVVNSLVGFAGLKPTLKALECDKKIALANKESLVVAGAFIDSSKLVPIDSEHFGLWYLLNDKKPTKMTITASGGAFRDTPLNELPFKDVNDALKHPNWSMGRKITIDSASMVNKIFELLEARWLFKSEEFDAIIETKSIIHAVVDFVDGSSTAHIAGANMQLPIAYALLGKVDEPILPHVNLLDIGELNFRAIEPNRYPVWCIKDELLKNPKLGVVVNAANEVMMNFFVSGECSILELGEGIVRAFRKFKDSQIDTVEDIFSLDKCVRVWCEQDFKGRE